MLYEYECTDPLCLTIIETTGPINTTCPECKADMKLIRFESQPDQHIESLKKEIERLRGRVSELETQIEGLLDDLNLEQPAKPIFH